MKNSVGEKRGWGQVFKFLILFSVFFFQGGDSCGEEEEDGDEEEEGGGRGKNNFCFL